MEREIKFEVKFRRKDGTDSYCEYLALDELLNRNGSLFHPGIWEVVYKRQFTGLLDKNKREIYEGDVVKYYNYFRGEELIAEVRFMLGGYWFWRDGHIASFHNIFTGQAPTIPSQTSSDFEVIGNIYENPELLK